MLRQQTSSPSGEQGSTTVSYLDVSVLAGLQFIHCFVNDAETEPQKWPKHIQMPHQSV